MKPLKMLSLKEGSQANRNKGKRKKKLPVPTLKSSLKNLLLNSQKRPGQITKCWIRICIKSMQRNCHGILTWTTSMTSRSLLASELAERLRMRPELSASACWEEEEGGQAGRDRSKGSLVADLITVSRVCKRK
jgi:hypothetical protein